MESKVHGNPKQTEKHMTPPTVLQNVNKAHVADPYNLYLFTIIITIVIFVKLIFIKE